MVKRTVPPPSQGKLPPAPTKDLQYRELNRITKVEWQTAQKLINTETAKTKYGPNVYRPKDKNYSFVIVEDNVYALYNNSFAEGGVKQIHALLARKKEDRKKKLVMLVENEYQYRKKWIIPEALANPKYECEEDIAIGYYRTKKEEGTYVPFEVRKKMGSKGNVFVNNPVPDIYKKEDKKEGKVPHQLIYTIMDHIEGVNLKDYLNTHTINDEQKWMIAALMTLELRKLHKLGFIHGDLSMDNFMIHVDKKTGNITIQIIDFDAVQKLPPGKNQVTVNRPSFKKELYAPQEVTKDRAYSFKSDVYALGRCFQFREPKGLGMGSLDFVRKMANSDINKRSSMTTVLQELKKGPKSLKKNSKNAEIIKQLQAKLKREIPPPPPIPSRGDMIKEQLYEQLEAIPEIEWEEAQKLINSKATKTKYGQHVYRPKDKNYYFVKVKDNFYAVHEHPFAHGGVKHIHPLLARNKSERKKKLVMLVENEYQYREKWVDREKVPPYESEEDIVHTKFYKTKKDEKTYLPFAVREKMGSRGKVYVNNPTPDNSKGEDVYNNMLYLTIMDHIEGVNLKDYLKTHKLDDEQKWMIAALMTLELRKLHKLGFIHGDLSPDNFMIHVDKKTKKITIKILDFDSVKKLPPGKNQVTVNRPSAIKLDFAPQEVTNDQTYSEKSDVYGLGGCFFLPQGLNMGTFDFVRSMYRNDQKRISMTEVLKGLGKGPKSLNKDSKNTAVIKQLKAELISEEKLIESEIVAMHKSALDNVLKEKILDSYKNMDDTRGIYQQQKSRKLFLPSFITKKGHKPSSKRTKQINTLQANLKSINDSTNHTSKEKFQLSYGALMVMDDELSKNLNKYRNYDSRLKSIVSRMSDELDTSHKELYGDYLDEEDCIQAFKDETKPKERLKSIRPSH